MLKKKSKNRIKIVCILICFVIAGMLSKYVYEQPQYAYQDDVNPIITTITMLDVGQGESILLQSQDETMIYDGGGRAKSSYVVSYVNSQNITRIKYMFVSHYDEDHIAGLIGILNTYEVENVICPDYQTDTKIYESFIRHLENTNANVIHPQIGDTYVIGESQVEVVYCDNHAIEENNRSIAIRITSGKASMLVMGDCEQEAEDHMVQNHLIQTSNVLVVGHHGSNSSTTDRLLDDCNPQYAWISVGEDNDYYHPHTTVLHRLNKRNIQIFRTDLQQEIKMYITQDNYWFSHEPLGE